MSGTTVQRAKQAVKSDAINAAYRVAAKNLVRVVKKPLLATLKKQGMQKPVLEMIGGFIDTDLGSALLAYAIGSGMCALPFLANHPKASRLAEECRIQGMEVFGDAGVQFAMATFGPVLGSVIDYVNAQPEIPGEKSTPAQLPVGFASFMTEETETAPKAQKVTANRK
jgi:hypothetical protein